MLDVSLSSFFLSEFSIASSILARLALKALITASVRKQLA